MDYFAFLEEWRRRIAQVIEMGFLKLKDENVGSVRNFVWGSVLEGVRTP